MRSPQKGVNSITQFDRNLIYQFEIENFPFESFWHFLSLSSVVSHWHFDGSQLRIFCPGVSHISPVFTRWSRLTMIKSGLHILGTDMYWLYGWIKIKHQLGPSQGLWMVARLQQRGAQLRGMGIASFWVLGPMSVWQEQRLAGGPFGPNVWAMPGHTHLDQNKHTLW